MDPLTPAEHIVAGLRSRNFRGLFASHKRLVIRALTTDEGVNCPRADLIASLRFLATYIDAPELVEDLDNLQDWLTKGGFVPRVEEGS